MNTLSMAISPSGSQPVEAELTKNGMLRLNLLTIFSGSVQIEGVHPLQFGFVRRETNR